MFYQTSSRLMFPVAIVTQQDYTVTEQLRVQVTVLPKLRNADTSKVEVEKRTNRECGRLLGRCSSMEKRARTPGG